MITPSSGKMNLLLLFAVLLLYVSGLFVTLFISHIGGVLSLVAFFTMWIVLILRGSLGVFNESDGVSGISLATLRRLRRYTRRALPILGILFVAGLVAVFSQPGVCVTDNLPLIAHREHYVLVSHSVYTEVGSLRYYVAGFGFLAGWNSIPLAGTLEALGRYIQKEIYTREG